MERKLKEIEQKIAKAERLKIAASIKRENSLKEWKTLMGELEQYGLPAGSNLSALKQFIEEKEKELNEKMTELEKLLPEDILNKYSEMSIDDLENQKAINEMNLILA